MFEIIRNRRIAGAPVAVTFGDYGERRYTLDEALPILARYALLGAPGAEGLYDEVELAKARNLHKVEWSDGGVGSWAHLSWSFYKDQGILYINSACGSDLFTVKFSVSEVIQALRVPTDEELDEAYARQYDDFDGDTAGYHDQY